MWCKTATSLITIGFLFTLLAISPASQVYATHLSTHKLVRQTTTMQYLTRPLGFRPFSSRAIPVPLFSNVQKDPQRYKAYLNDNVDTAFVKRYTISSSPFIIPFHDVFNEPPETSSITLANRLLANLAKLTVYTGALDRHDRHCFMRDKNCSLPLLKKDDFVVNPRFWSTSPQISAIDMIYNVNDRKFMHFSGSLHSIWQQNEPYNFGRDRVTLINITGPHFGRLLWGASLYPHQADIMTSEVEDSTPECVLSPLHLFKVQTAEYKENVIWLDLQSLQPEEQIDMMKSRQMIISSSTGHRRTYADYVKTYHGLGLMPSSTETFYEKLIGCL